MAKARAIIKRRKSVQNIRKITRTMELIATARFKKSMDRAVQAEAYTRKIGEIVADLAGAAAEVGHPLLAARPAPKRALLLMLTSNRGLAGGYNANVLRGGTKRYEDFLAEGVDAVIEVAGKRGISYCRFRGFKPDVTYTQFEDKPQFDEVEPIAARYIALFERGEIDRVDVAYTRFLSASRQEAVVRTLLPMGSLAEAVAPSRPDRKPAAGAEAEPPAKGKVVYDFLPNAAGILAEIVPAAFKAQLFKCFLDAAVSEQIARMIAMRGATENADQMVKTLTRLYNRARQSQITRELAELIGGAAALE